VQFEATPIAGVWSIALEPHRDARGTFVRTFDEAMFAQRGLEHAFPQHSEAWNDRAGTIRGLHLQTEPHGETKIIRVVRGALFDVLVDVRPGPGYGTRWAIELRAGEPRALYCPRGIAHGYQTLESGTLVSYLISAPYVADAAGGIHWQSPALAIPWPLPVSVISERDAAFAAFEVKGR
jgi:dTDP-4-dehydrorhamnose 3,5-epimerase